MISYARARRLLARSAKLLPEEIVPLTFALGRVVSKDICSREDLPAFDNSSMDGYALRGPAKRGERFPVAGTIFAGDPPRTLEKRRACEIMTGAPLPEGANAVIPVEWTARDGRFVVIGSPVAPGDNVRRAGTDFRKGDVVAAAGTTVEPRHLLALSSLGASSVAVRRKPRIAVISTGKELISPGRKVGRGQIRDGSSSYLIAALTLLGCEARFHGIVADDPRDFSRRMRAVLATRPDVVVTTGAVSMGKRDFVAQAVQDLGAKLLYHKVALRPGKPGLVARFGSGTIFFGLPGNPISTVVGLRFFVEPFLRALLGAAPEKPVMMPLAAAAGKPRGLRCFFKARREGGRVRALAGQGSHMISPLLAADSWVVFPESGARVAAGKMVAVYPL